ncbi:unnamed protein product [Enterobius vermicularis]|uniref:Ubiquitin-like protein ATG12 n=1 Tax=Enterobius vermicularis TaxID=51028 RepID=A0A0N4V9U2_ENTVE|nr:unnamed protein product [Enterobius vermicularis]
MRTSKVSGLQWLYLQYILVTGLYMVEPWERAIFNCFFIGFIGILFYIVCSFIFVILFQAGGKVKILLKAVGGAPIMKQKCFSVNESTTVAELTANIRKILKLGSNDSLFLYVNQCFAPSPDQTLLNLRNCFAAGISELVLHYSLTSAWG